MKFSELSDSELKVMEVLWAKAEPVSFGELLEYFTTHTDKNWKKQTLNTFLYRMQKKELLQIVEDEKYKKYLPAMTKEEYKLLESKAFLNKNYQGSIVKMLTAFSGGEVLEKEEIDELKKIIKEWEKE